MRSTYFLVGFFLNVVVSGMATAEPASPVLRYTPPTNTLRSAAGGPADDYAFYGFNASVQVYPFRPFKGDIEEAFRRTLLREWIQPIHREQNAGSIPPNFQKSSIPGAELVLTVSFAENISGLARPHLRMVVVAHGEAAIVDASAGTRESWQLALPQLNAMDATLRVETAGAPPPLDPKAGRAVAGLYRGMKQKYTAALPGAGGSGSTGRQHFYLLSADGRLYRAYDEIELPGGDATRFDFDAAAAREPGNTGRYTIAAGKLLIRMGGPLAESIVADAPKDGAMTIDRVLYKRQ